MNRQQIRRTVLTAVFTALIAAGAYAAVPIGPVPIVMTSLFVILSGLLGGFRIGLYSTAAYLLLGILGASCFCRRRCRICRSDRPYRRIPDRVCTGCGDIRTAFSSLRKGQP